MTNLNRFFQKEDTTSVSATNSFDTVSEADLSRHLEIANYGDFELTDAVRPAMDLKIKPSEGYRHDVYIDHESQSRVPVVMASASREKLFPLFMKLIQKLGPVVDVVLESSHDQSGGHVDLYREHIDMPVLTSVLWDFEDLLMNDGCTGIAVLNPNTPQEIQFEEHKLLIVYGSPLEPYEFILESAAVRENEKIRFISEAEHIHSSSDEYSEQFFRLRAALGLDGSANEMDGPVEDGYQNGDGYQDDDGYEGIC